MVSAQPSASKSLCARFESESSVANLTPALKVTQMPRREIAMQQTSAPPFEAQDLASTMFLRMPSVMKMTGLGRSTIYRLMAQKQFPCPVRLGVRAVAWRRSELNEWSQTRSVASL
jgi:prophage regulatory protein